MAIFFMTHVIWFYCDRSKIYAKTVEISSISFSIKCLELWICKPKLEQLKSPQMLLNCMRRGRIEVGCDEAGRGSLAGPVYAAAVILPKSFNHPLLDDSKKLTEQSRELLRPVIERKAIDWAVAFVDNRDIDELNILNASILAMHRALDKLNIYPDALLIDGNKFKPYKDVKHFTVVNGDATYKSIAAASILAKTHRDEFMQKLHDEFPQYGWDKNKAYPTPKHRQAIQKYGITVHHRRSYHLVKAAETLEF